MHTEGPWGSWPPVPHLKKPILLIEEEYLVWVCSCLVKAFLTEGILFHREPQVGVDTQHWQPLEGPSKWPQGVREGGQLRACLYFAGHVASAGDPQGS